MNALPLSTGLAALDDTDWSRLHHAYGPATDTPAHLRALLEKDGEPRREALFHLWSAILHQGTPWLATAPAALVVAGFLSGERLDQADPIRANLLSFLVSVAEVAAQPGTSIGELEQQAALDPLPEEGQDFEDDEAISAVHARAVLGCIQIAPVLMKVMLEGLDHGNPKIRMHAAMGAATLAQVDSLRATEIEPRLLAMARATRNSDERGALLLSLGELGFLPTEFLTDPSLAVRMCAALAPGLADHCGALKVLIDILEEHAGAIGDWFGENPPQFEMHPRFAVVRRLVEQVHDFDLLADAAIAVLDVTAKYSVDFDWGPLLVAAFEDGSGQPSTRAQRRFLHALVDKKEFWDATFGNAQNWFEMAGLPYDQSECAARCREGDR